jgi:hypothetical protein
LLRNILRAAASIFSSVDRSLVLTIRFNQLVNKVNKEYHRLKRIDQV